jgi:hypothetical protein
VVVVKIRLDVEKREGCRKSIGVGGSPAFPTSYGVYYDGRVLAGKGPVENMEDMEPNLIL